MIVNANKLKDNRSVTDFHKLEAEKSIQVAKASFQRVLAISCELEETIKNELRKRSGEDCPAANIEKTVKF